MGEVVSKREQMAVLRAQRDEAAKGVRELVRRLDLRRVEWARPVRVKHGDDYMRMMPVVDTAKGAGRCHKCPICEELRWSAWAQARRHWQRHSLFERYLAVVGAMTAVWDNPDPELWDRLHTLKVTYSELMREEDVALLQEFLDKSPAEQLQVVAEAGWNDLGITDIELIRVEGAQAFFLATVTNPPPKAVVHEDGRIELKVHAHRGNTSVGFKGNPEAMPGLDDLLSGRLHTEEAEYE